MIIWPIQVGKTVKHVIELGRQGENKARQIQFDLTQLIDTYGEGSATLVFQRYRDPAPYIVPTERDGNLLLWTVTKTDTAVAGLGRAEIRWSVDGTLAKTVIFKTGTVASLASDTVIPDRMQTWYDQLVEYIDSHSISSVTMNADYTITFTFTDGTAYTTPVLKGEAGPQGPQGPKGEEGSTGQDGLSPSISITDITGGHRVTITDATGSHSFDVMDGDDAEAPVQDVQVNGASIMDTNGVANVPVASSSTLGVVKYNIARGTEVGSDGTIVVKAASDNTIKSGVGNYQPIVPTTQHRATFYGLAKAAGDTTQSASSNAVGNYTEDAKSAISEMLGGSVAVSGTAPTINAKAGIRYVCGEVSTLDITLPASGIVDVVFTSGSTPTVLTITPPTGQTVKWANGFDPTNLDADTTYEINVADGLGVAASWT